MFDSSKWNIQTQDESLAQSLASALGTDELCARLLINRGYCDVSKAKAFIDKSNVFFHNPYLMKDIGKAVAIIKEAIENDEKITIYGDYDVDGVTSVSILYMYLREHGATVDYYIPTRDSEGYGLNTSAFDIIKQKGTDLIITVDTGITATEEVSYAKSIGMKVIVTDHHECRPELPGADAVVNPKRPDCEYPFKELSGVGVVFKIICALELDYVNGGEYNLYTIKDMCKRYIDIVTIGTIADVMPLVGENRIIVHLGLGMLQNARQVGIRALFRASGVIGGNTQKKITASTISFTIAPKINAVGRIGSAERAVKLFLTESPANAEIIAEELCAINRERQELENIIYKDAFEQISSVYKPGEDSVIVLSSDSWHHGFIGIVSSRLTEKFGVPSVLISFEGATPDENGALIGKGSVRSVRGINIVEALSSCADILSKFGGHALAAGLSIEINNVDEFRRRLNEYIKNNVKDSDMSMMLNVEAEINENNVTEKTADSISLLEPYGAGNPVPLFALRNAKITEIVPLSLGKHTKMMLRRGDKDIYSVIFGCNLCDEGFAVGDLADIVCSIDINEFRGNRNVQLIIRDIDRSQSDKDRFKEESKQIADLLFDPSELESEEVPDRNDFIKMYSALKNEGENPVYFRSLAQLSGDISYIKLAIAVRAFEEAGIISITDDSDNIILSKIKLNKIDGKTDLMQTTIMKKINNIN